MCGMERRRVAWRIESCQQDEDDTRKAWMLSRKARHNKSCMCLEEGGHSH